MAMSKALEALVAIQSELKAPKTESAGRYRYRNIEDINEAVKPLAAKHGCAVTYTDAFVDGACVSTCRLIAEDGELYANGVAYVNRTPKNMSVEQASGAASSYARKYAACGLFAIDSSEHDPDRTNAKKSTSGAALNSAKKRLMAAIDKWAELNGMDASGAKSGIQKRPGYAENADNPEWFIAIAEEFENA